MIKTKRKERKPSKLPTYKGGLNWPQIVKKKRRKRKEFFKRLRKYVVDPETIKNL